MLKQELECETNRYNVSTQAPEPAQEVDIQVETDTCVTDTVVLNNLIEQRGSSRKKNRHNIILAACVSSFILGFPVSLVGSSIAPTRLFVFMLFFGAIISFAGLVGIPITLVSRYSADSRSSASEPMPDETGLAAIGPLLDRMTTDVDNIAAIRERLTGLLTQLTLSDSPLLERRHYKQLNMYLQRMAWEISTVRAPERSYLIAVLEAYSCVGDPRAIPHVERIAKGKANTTVRDAEVRAAALRCLAHLNEAAAQLGHHNTLLRSAQLSDAGGELVRPAGSSTDIDPAQLMRPAASDDGAKLDQ